MKMIHCSSLKIRCRGGYECRHWKNVSSSNNLIIVQNTAEQHRAALAQKLSLSGGADFNSVVLRPRRHPRHHELDRSELCLEDNGPERAGQITAELTTDRRRRIGDFLTLASDFRNFQSKSIKIKQITKIRFFEIANYMSHIC